MRNFCLVDRIENLIPGSSNLAELLAWSARTQGSALADVFTIGPFYEDFIGNLGLRLVCGL